MKRFVCLLVASVMWVPVVKANDRALSEEMLIGSILLDRTLTPYGKQYFKLFSEAWNNNAISADPSQALGVSVKETLLPQSRSIISLLVDHKIISRVLISQRQRNQLPEQAKQSFNALVEHIAATRMDSDTIDIAGSGM